MTTTAKEETMKHRRQVYGFLLQSAINIMARGYGHDASKLKSPEVEIFDEFTEKLKGSTYGSPEYAEMLKAMKPALDHHYKNNRHHPEYHADGVKGMTLLDMLEMLCDWKAATMRHADGSIEKSLEINQKRFGFSDELKTIFKNTLKELDL